MTELFAWDAAGVPAALTGTETLYHFILFHLISPYFMDVCPEVSGSHLRSPWCNLN